jgi:glucose/arabinose dehydrogenase
MSRTLAAGLVLLVVACSGGGDSPMVSAPAGSAVNVQFAGLPAGADAYARLDGPGGAVYFNSSRTFSPTAAGMYTVTAFDVLAGSNPKNVMQAPAAQAFTLADNETRNVAVTYTAGPAFNLQLQEVLGTGAGLEGPIDLQAPPGDARIFIAEREGRLRIYQGGTLLATPFLDISNRIPPFVGEDGLLSFAFHPQYPSQPYVFVHFTDRNAGANDIVVERYQLSMDPNVLQTSGTEVIRIPHPGQTNHYGGRVAFGPDGMLYLSTGDGGGGGDPQQNGQNPATLLGKLLRLDVSALPYTIPANNPTWPGMMPRRENWAIGLRNPFRYSFDVPSGLLYIGDVGQGQREEIDAVPATVAGLNYGWNVMEGTICYPGGSCNMTGLTLPIHDYDHNQGCSITGGYVYRGAAIPELQGRYLYSDYCGGFLRSLRYENGIVTERLQWVTGIGNVYSFGQDGAGELYVLTQNGRVLRVVKQ